MENHKIVLGVDVSKLTLDISCAARNLKDKIDNDTTGFMRFKKGVNKMIST